MKPAERGYREVRVLAGVVEVVADQHARGVAGPEGADRHGRGVEGVVARRCREQRAIGDVPVEWDDVEPVADLRLLRRRDAAASHQAPVVAVEVAEELGRGLAGQAGRAPVPGRAGATAAHSASSLSRLEGARGTRYGSGVTQTEIIEEIGRRLAEAVPAGSEILLFGSRARGNAADDSDYDVLVIEPNVDRPMDESVRLRRQLNGLDCPIDVVVFSADRAKTWSKVRGTVVERARREGRVLAHT